MTDFAPFGLAIHRRYLQLSTHELFTTIDGRALSDAYLKAFPEGTNPIYKTNTEHHCSCCFNFIRNIGNVVAVIDGRPQSVWDAESLEYPYNVVASELDHLVTQHPITGVFRTKEASYGAASTMQLQEDKTARRWNHFHGAVGTKHFTNVPDKLRGEYKTSVDVLKRGLEELSLQALDDVLDLINNKTLYRGEEHQTAVAAFRAAHIAWGKAENKDAWVWHNAANMQVSRFRNTVIGTLIQDLSEGKELEYAVKAFEDKVAPVNYKRPTALVTPSMVTAAVKTLEDLDLQDSLRRRFARIEDVSVNNVLWADRGVKDLMKSDIYALMAGAITQKAPKKINTDVAEMSIDDFMQAILPTADSVELLVKNTHTNNFMSITTCDDDRAANLFKWDNRFAWAYAGSVTDSIQEKVKRAGGNISAAMRVSLAWFNRDDLDLHCSTPGGMHVFFGNKMGILDVDMNAGYGVTREPVENMAFNHMPVGRYTFHVNQYNQREKEDPGFVIEIAVRGQIQQYSYPKELRGQIEVAKIDVARDGSIQVGVSDKLIDGTASKERWGIKTETFVKVNTILYSPNYWDDNKVGNKHYFFILEGCTNDEPTRGFFNEYLHGRLDQHRKVFEILGDKTKVPPSDAQLSGLGFSSTRGDKVTVRVKTAKRQQTLNVTF